MTMASTDSKIKVCVVGAGAAGLCAARHLAEDRLFEFLVYEQTDNIGGTWVYNNEGIPGVDRNNLPIHSSMYRNLRTNLPAKIMNFPDFMMMNSEEHSCFTHQEVLAYLCDYAQQFRLHKHIQFNVRVENVRNSTVSEIGKKKWSVRLKHIKTQAAEYNDFDAIMICNGHYFEPYEPPIVGMESFVGEILHSHLYREPEKFAGKTVFVLGAGASGIDIAIDLANYASRIYLSHNHGRIPSPLPCNMTQVVGIQKISGNRIFLRDDSVVIADVFIYCTGYKYSFPFLDETCGISVDENHVKPLYMHLINIEHPTMCFIGLPTNVVPFPMFHVQVQYFLALLKNRVSLPPKSVMLSMDSSMLKGGEPKRHAHRLMDRQWDYNDFLSIAGGFSTLPAWYKTGYIAWQDKRRTNLLSYKNSKFIVSADGKTVRVIPNETDLTVCIT